MSSVTSPITWTLQFEDFGADGPPYGNNSVPSGSPVPTLGPKINALDSALVFESANAEGLDTSEWEGLANSYTCPRGKHIGTGYLLLLAVDGFSLNLDNSYTLTISDGDNTAVIPRVYIVRVTALWGDTTPANAASDPVADDPDHASSDGVYPQNSTGSSAPNTANARRTSLATVCLVEIADRRRLMTNADFSGPFAKAPHGGLACYNIRAAGSSGQDRPLCYDPFTINMGAAYSWQGILSNIWGFMESFWSTTGISPTLPISAVSTSTPEGFRFISWTPWDAYHYTLTRIFCELAFNPFSLNSAFSIVRLGEVQAGLQAALTAAEPQLDSHNDTIQGQAPNVPNAVNVYFPQIALHYGIDPGAFSVSNTTPAIASSRLEFDKFYVTVGGTPYSPPPNAMEGVSTTWIDDLPALVNPNGSVTNTTETNARVTEVNQNFTDYFTNASFFFQKIYNGVVTTLLPGSQISSVRWYEDDGGMKTEVRSDVDPAFMNGWSFSSRDGGELAYAESCNFKNLNRPESMRVLAPYVPQTDQLVYVADSVPNSDGLLSGYIFLTDPLNTNTPPFLPATSFSYSTPGSAPWAPSHIVDGTFNFAASNGQQCWVLPTDWYASMPLPYTGGTGTPPVQTFPSTVGTASGAPGSSAGYMGIRIGRMIGSRTSGGVTLPLVGLYTGFMQQEFGGRAVANWMRADFATTPGSYVQVQPFGSSITVSVAIVVGDPGIRAPNVVSGDFIRYRFDACGRPWMMNQEMWDDAIGTVKLFGNYNPPRGWGKADGSGNSSANGGSGYNWYVGADGTTNNYLRLGNGPSNFGGVNQLFGGLTNNTDVENQNGQQVQSGTGVTVAAHTHTHKFPATGSPIPLSSYAPYFVQIGLMERLNNSATPAGYIP